MTRGRPVFLVTLMLFIFCFTANLGYAAQTKPKITFLHYLSVETMEILQPLIDQFETANNMTVDVISVSSAEVVTKLQVMAATGVMPDVMRLGSEFINLIPMNPFADLSPYVTQDRVAMTDFYQPVYASFTLNTKLLALPTDISTYAMFYNVEQFDQAGLAHPSHDWSSTTWTWDTMIKAAVKLTSAPTTSPRRYGIQTLSPISLWPWWWGGEWLDPQTRKPLADTPNTMLAMQKVADAYTVHDVMGGNFSQGTAGMVLNLNAAIPTYAKQTSFKWDVAPLAMGTQRRTILYPNGLFMSSTSGDKEAAWKFIKYITTQLDAAKTWSTALGRIPALRRLGPHYIEMQKKLRNDADHQVFLGAMDYAQYPTTRMVPEALEVEKILNAVFTNIRTGKISVQAGALEMNKLLNALLAGR